MTHDQNSSDREASAKLWVLRKRGLFYRAGDHGYTANINDAGRYTRKEAEDRVCPHDEPVTMHLASDYEKPDRIRDLVGRAIRCARPHRTTEAPRWVAVRDVFGIGSTSATELCLEFGLDPHELVSGATCSCEDSE